jgi:hypothetical protein
MTPKEKARELRDKMYLKIPSVYDPTSLPHYPIAKEMALIAVDEVIKMIDNQFVPSLAKLTPTYRYWQEVKEEIIENL